MAKHLYPRLDEIEVSTTGFGIWSGNLSYAEIVGTDRSRRQTNVGRCVWVLRARIDALEVFGIRGNGSEEEGEGRKEVVGSVQGGSGERDSCHDRRVKCSKVY